jgi:hypothetical protein
MQRVASTSQSFRESSQIQAADKGMPRKDSEPQIVNSGSTRIASGGVKQPSTPPAACTATGRATNLSW